VHSSIEAYDAYAAIIVDGTLTGFNKTAKAYCSEANKHAHAPVIWSSDAVSVEQCWAQCRGMWPQCTCFDFDNTTAPSDTCSPSDFTTNLTGLECMGLAPAQDKQITAEACAIACCATNGCEVYQFTTPHPEPSTFEPCWIGTLDQGGHSCVPSGNWVGGARPSPNQMFSLMTDYGALQSSLVDKTTPDSATQMCVHVRPATPQAPVVPLGTLVGLETCDSLANQQLVYDTKNGTIFLFDGVGSMRPQTACVDGTAKGPTSDQALMLQMSQCYTDQRTAASNKARAQEHQQWEYDASISKKVLWRECDSVRKIVDTQAFLVYTMPAIYALNRALRLTVSLSHLYTPAVPPRWYWRSVHLRDG
jgi:hypothetical protein